MSVSLDDLVAAFWQRVPEQVAEATNLWLGVEEGSTDNLSTLRRLLHTIKGEAHMLGLDEAGRILELCEQIVDIVRDQDYVPPGVGDVLLGAFEGVGVRATSLDAESPVDLQPMVADLEATLVELESATRGEVVGGVARPSIVPGAPTRSGSQRPSGRAAVDDLRSTTSDDRTAGVDDATDAAEWTEHGSPQTPEQRAREAASAAERRLVRELLPAVHELRRLSGELSLLQPQLREAQRMLRALLVEVDPSLSAAALKERVIKTLNYGGELERRIAKVRTAWSANDFATDLALTQLERRVQEASLVSTDELRQQVLRVVRTTARAVGKDVKVEVRGHAFVDAAIENRLRPALLHIIRNAVDHGIEDPEERLTAGKPRIGVVKVAISQDESSVRVVVEDDGRGIDFEGLRVVLRQQGVDEADLAEADLLKALFRQGVTTRHEVTEISGRGVGLDVVAREVQAVGGTVAIETHHRMGTRLVISLPVTIRADLVVPVISHMERYALPTRAITHITRLEDLVETTAGPQVRLDRGGSTDLLPVYSLGALLHGQGEIRLNSSAVVLNHQTGRFCVTVDGYENPRPIQFERTEDLAFGSSLVRGVAPAADGGVLLLLDVEILHQLATGSSGASDGHRGKTRQTARVLVVEDAPVARELLVGVLRSFGMSVVEAIDGQQGLNLAMKQPPDLILTDIEMPFMDGLEMVSRMHDEPRLMHIPVIVLTTRVDDGTRSRADALGVRGFLSKQRFVEDQLRKLVDECLGRR